MPEDRPSSGSDAAGFEMPCRSDWHEFSFRRMLRLVYESAKLGFFIILRPVIAFTLVYLIFKIMGLDLYKDALDRKTSSAPENMIGEEINLAMQDLNKSYIERLESSSAELECRPEDDRGTVGADVANEFLTFFYGSDGQQRPWYVSRVTPWAVAVERESLWEIRSDRERFVEAIRAALLSHAMLNNPNQPVELPDVEISDPVTERHQPLLPTPPAGSALDAE